MRLSFPPLLLELILVNTHCGLERHLNFAVLAILVFHVAHVEVEIRLLVYLNLLELRFLEVLNSQNRMTFSAVVIFHTFHRQ